jgi:predicted porin
MAFGLGAAYTEQEAGLGGAFEADTWTVGADYTTGPFKFGLNYYNQDRDFFDVAEIETQRYSAGVVYTYGPGMTFRGSINYTDHDTPKFGDASDANEAATNQDQDATSVLLGTQINF